LEEELRGRNNALLKQNENQEKQIQQYHNENEKLIQENIKTNRQNQQLIFDNQQQQTQIENLKYEWEQQQAQNSMVQCTKSVNKTYVLLSQIGERQKPGRNHQNLAGNDQ